MAYESGAARTVDPLGGSHYVEWLTDEMETGMRQVIDEIEAYGGAVKAIEEGYLQSRTAQAAKRRKEKIDEGETVVVGQNYFRRDDGTNDFGEVFRLDPEVSARVLEKYQAILDSRDNAAAEAALGALDEAAGEDGENLLPYLIECCHAYATVGEMVAVLKARWGEFQEPVKF